MVKEKYAKVFVEESIVIKEDYGMVASGSDLKRTFVDPFANVLKAVKLTLKDVGVGVLYNMRILFTFSTTKKQRLLNAYKQRQEMFQKEHEQFRKSLGDMSEAKLLLFMANPALYIGATAIEKGVDVASFVNDTFKEQRKALKDQEEGGEGPDGSPTGDARGPIRGALRDLKNLFFGESYVDLPWEDKLLEVGGQNLDVAIEVEEEIKKQGIDIDLNQVKSTFEDFVKGKEEAIKEIEDEGIPARIEALSDMMAAKNYDELSAAVTKAKAAEIDMGNYLKEFDAELTRSKKEISDAFADESASSKLIDQMKKLPSIKKLGDKATQQDYQDAVEDYLFNNLKKNLQEDGEKIISDIRADMQEVSQILMLPFKSAQEMSELKKVSPEAEKVVSKIESMVNLIQGK